jgi:hypothetical protein
MAQIQIMIRSMKLNQYQVLTKTILTQLVKISLKKNFKCGKSSYSYLKIQDLHVYFFYFKHN